MHMREWAVERERRTTISSMKFATATWALRYNSCPIENWYRHYAYIGVVVCHSRCRENWNSNQGIGIRVKVFARICVLSSVDIWQVWPSFNGYEISRKRVSIAIKRSNFIRKIVYIVRLFEFFSLISASSLSFECLSFFKQKHHLPPEMIGSKCCQTIICKFNSMTV